MPLGCVIFGMEDSDVRLPEQFGFYQEDGRIPRLLDRMSDRPSEDVPDSLRNALFYRIGQAVRRLHDAGYVHGILHLGNVGVVRTRKGSRLDNLYIVIRDHETAVKMDIAWSPEQQILAKFLDLQRLLRDISLNGFEAKEFVENLMEGYFGDRNEWSNVFKDAVTQSLTLQFRDKIDRLLDPAYTSGSLPLDRQDATYGPLLTLLISTLPAAAPESGINMPKRFGSGTWDSL